MAKRKDSTRSKRTSSARLWVQVLVAPLLSFMAFGLLLALGAGPEKHAEPPPPSPSDWRVTRYDQVATLGLDGSTEVVVSMSFNFGESGGRGPVLTFPERHISPGHLDRWQNTPMEVLEVTSPSGAPADRRVTSENGVLTLRIGRQEEFVHGQHEYTIRYRVEGLVTPNHPASGLDEFNWNAIGAASTVPIDAPRLTLVLPAQVQRLGCFTGAQFDQPCATPAIDDTEANENGQWAIEDWEIDDLGRGEGWQVVAGFAAGTFSPDVAARESRVYRWRTMFSSDPAPLLTAVAIPVLAIGTHLLWVWRRRRPTERREIAVRFDPPGGSGSGGIEPGVLGVLADGEVNPVDMAASIVDLVVRRQVLMDRRDLDDWSISRADRQQRALLHRSTDTALANALFSVGEPLTAARWGSSKGGPAHNQLRRSLETAAGVHEWFTQPPQQLADRLRSWYGLVFAFTLVIIAALSFVGFGWAGLAIGVTAWLLTRLPAPLPKFTAGGTDAWYQAQGFRLYLTTAEGPQLRFEDGGERFARYLPYAMVFGVVGQWAAALSRGAQDPQRYLGGLVAVGEALDSRSLRRSLTRSVDEFSGSVTTPVHVAAIKAQAAMTAVSAARWASSGGSGGRSSGFGGGGGGGGGSVGGW
ncbi:DUF2207 family protein [Aestuariimicrobium ganziense]|uniref:DUF2207 family protein n=1 Tax=Aestuariimicrobium ganziense TaxID=2773677 RepID=UPI001945B25D|nr:DUF2207 domain-containing protein [Aestuariimicrobium ganziense]